MCFGAQGYAGAGPAESAAVTAQKEMARAMVRPVGLRTIPLYVMLTSNPARMRVCFREFQQMQLTQQPYRSAKSLLIRWVKRLILAKLQKVTSLEQDAGAADARAWQQLVHSWSTPHAPPDLDDCASHHDRRSTSAS